MHLSAAPIFPSLIILQMKTSNREKSTNYFPIELYTVNLQSSRTLLWQFQTNP